MFSRIIFRQAERCAVLGHSYYIAIWDGLRPSEPPTCVYCHSPRKLSVFDRLGRLIWRATGL